MAEYYYKTVTKSKSLQIVKNSLQMHGGVVKKNSSQIIKI